MQTLPDDLKIAIASFIEDPFLYVSLRNTCRSFQKGLPKTKSVTGPVFWALITERGYRNLDERFLRHIRIVSLIPELVLYYSECSCCNLLLPLMEELFIKDIPLEPVFNPPIVAFRYFLVAIERHVHNLEFINRLAAITSSGEPIAYYAMLLKLARDGREID